MYSQLWHVGIDLCQTTIQLVAARRSRKHWHLCECWQHPIPNQISDLSENKKRAILLDILVQWRRKLPKNCQVSIAFPSLRTIKQQITLPEQLTLQQPELGWYLRAQAEKLFPLSIEELTIDYRVINRSAYLNGVRRSEILFWQELFQNSGFILTAIDVAPCVLRYLARLAELPDESWLVHYRQGEWLWSGPISQPANYNQIQDSDITTLNQLLPLLTETNTSQPHPVYYIGDDHQSQAKHSWNLLQAFQRYSITLPHQLGDYVIAAGLALRQKDNEGDKYVSG